MYKSMSVFNHIFLSNLTYTAFFIQIIIPTIEKEQVQLEFIPAWLRIYYYVSILLKWIYVVE